MTGAGSAPAEKPQAVPATDAAPSIAANAAADGDAAQTSRQIIQKRGPRNTVDPWKPYAYLIEPERSRAGIVEDVATVFLTNRECPFHCLMCDLWQNTTTTTVPVGAIPAQIDFALARMQPASTAARVIKLYNSGNFFDPKAIPAPDWPAIAARVSRFKTVIVENHPRLCSARCAEFQQLLTGQFEVALGLETIHPEILPALNKQMTVADFDIACGLLQKTGIAIRAFVLLQPPLMKPGESVEWAVRSARHAFDQGAGVVSIIPTRSGNGAMDELERTGTFRRPSLDQLEEVFEKSLALGQGRVFVDLWGLETTYAQEPNRLRRLARLRDMNLQQVVLPAVS